jgi:hypothetical protein
VAREQRKLAAIIAADVVGFSRLMGRDEDGTLVRLRKNRSERLDPVVAKYGGRLVKLTGDGALVEFASAVDALSAAIEFQQAMACTWVTSSSTATTFMATASTWRHDWNAKRPQATAAMCASPSRQGRSPRIPNSMQQLSGVNVLKA